MNAICCTEHYLGAAGQVSTQYFASSVYRNILDMTMTLERRTNLMYSGVKVLLSYICQARDLEGFAIKALALSNPPQWGNWERLLKTRHGITKRPSITVQGPMGTGLVCMVPSIAATTQWINTINSTKYELVDLTRALDWELNRVHLPLPFNLRQWQSEFRNWITQTNFGEQVVKSSSVGTVRGIPYPGLKGLYIADKLKQLHGWLIQMRVRINAEISKAQLRERTGTPRPEDAREPAPLPGGSYTDPGSAYIDPLDTMPIETDADIEMPELSTQLQTSLTPTATGGDSSTVAKVGIFGGALALLYMLV